MRILFLDSESSWRGGQNQTLILMEGLQRHGVNCHLAAPAGAPLLAQARKREIPCVEASFSGWASWGTAGRLRQYCEEQEITIVDAQSSKAHTVGLLLKVRLKRLKLVVHRRVDYIPPDSWRARWKYLNKSIDHHIAISQAIGTILTHYGVPAERVSVVESCHSLGMDGSFDQVEQKKRLCAVLGLKEDIPLLATVAALTDQKDYPTLLAAYHKLKAQGEPFQAIIAGEGSLRNSLLAMRDRLGLTQDVHFLGFRDDVPDLLRASDVFVLPSAYEGLGTIFLDALMSDCLVVATNVGGIPEVIRHKETGFLVPPHAPDKLAAQVGYAVTNLKAHAPLILEGKKLVKERFSPTTMVAGNLAVFKSL